MHAKPRNLGMPSVPLIDTHLHLWDPQRLSYGWLKGNKILNRPHLVADYKRATAGVDVAGMVFVECDVDAGLFEKEVRLVEEEARKDPHIKAIGARASVGQGPNALPVLERLKCTTPLLRGIRRIIETDPDPEFCLRSSFIEGVKLVGQLGLSFEITVNFRHIKEWIALLDRALAGVRPEALKAFWRNNAIDFYPLDVPHV